jgi:prophage antirepressor-like protein
MELIKRFENENYNITTIKNNEDIYFKGKEIANILGYKDTDQAMRIHVEEEDKKKMEILLKMESTTRGVKNTGLKKMTYNELNTIYINESGLYSLVLRSKLPGAKEFKRWVTSEVLPSIRKNGKYEVPTNEQRLKEITMSLEILKMIDCVDDSIKSIAYSETKNILSNKINNTNDDEIDYPITRRIKDLGYSYTEKDHGKLVKIGNLLAKKYREKYNEKPKKRNAYVRGQLREINYYTKKDFDIMDKAIIKFFE